MKIAIGIPTCGPPTWMLLDSLLAFQAYHYHNHREDPIQMIRPPRPLPIATARSYIARTFVNDTDADVLWWIDQDAKFLPQTLDRLLSWNAPIVGALCFIRSREACMPMALTDPQPDGKYRAIAQEVYAFCRHYYDCESNQPQIILEPPVNSLHKIHFTGCHCTVVKREVFEAMEPPYFVGMPGQEDRDFYLNAKRYGFITYTDLSVLAGHGAGAERSIGLFDFFAHYRFIADCEEAKDAEGRQAHSVRSIGSIEPQARGPVD
jgi:hypothetical protein